MKRILAAALAIVGCLTALIPPAVRAQSGPPAVRAQSGPPAVRAQSGPPAGADPGPVVRIGDASPPTALPSVTAEVTLLSQSATGYSVTLSVHNNQPPSRPALSVPVSVTVLDAAGDVLSSGVQPLAVAALDTHFTGTVRLDVSGALTVLSLDPAITRTADAAGTHLLVPVTALDGGAGYATSFDVSQPMVPGPVGSPVAQPTPSIQSPSIQSPGVPIPAPAPAGP